MIIFSADTALDGDEKGRTPTRILCILRHGFACLAVFSFLIFSGCVSLSKEAPNPEASADTTPTQKAAEETADDNAMETLPGSITNLNLVECRAIAHKKNRGLQTARNDLASALAGGRIAEAEVFAPTFDISHAFKDGSDSGEARAELNYLTPLGIGVSSFLSETSDSEQEEEWTSDAGITLKRRLFAASERWRLRMPLTTAERNILKATNALRQEERELDYSVMQVFLAVQRTERSLDVRRARVADAKAFLTVTEERVANGLAPRVDIVNAQISLNSAEAEELSQQTTLQTQTESLLNTMGVTVTNDLTIDPLAVTNTLENTFDLEADARNMLAHHESLVNTRLDIALVEINIDIQKDVLWPRVDLSLTGEHKSEGSDPFNERDETSDAFSVQLTYTTQLDFKKGDRAELEQLKLGLENSQAGLVDKENSLLLRLRSIHRNTGRLKTQLGLSEQRLSAEREKLAATLVRYEDGGVDNLEVTRAKQAVDNAEISVINARIDLVLAHEEYHSLLPPDAPVQTELTRP